MMEIVSLRYIVDDESWILIKSEEAISSTRDNEDGEFHLMDKSRNSSELVNIITSKLYKISRKCRSLVSREMSDVVMFVHETSVWCFFDNTNLAIMQK